MDLFKPYDLVLVREKVHPKSDEYMYTGQVISLLAPDGTIGIRRIPGDPNSFATVDADDLIRYTVGMRKPKYVHWAVVTGRGSFPIDMLRYDSCVPANFEIQESGRYDIDHAKLLVGKVKAYGMELMVAQATESPLPAWTVDRWSSFLWGIKHVKTERIDA